MFHYRIKNVEPFKDGNVLDGRFVKAGEVLVVTELDKQRMEQSGALIEVMEILVKNPLKELAQKAAVEETVAVIEAQKEEPVEAPQPAKKRGRPRKNA